MYVRSCISLAIFTSIIVVTSAHTSMIHVPADSATIQGAIDGAVDGDTVLVAEGHYYERIDFGGKNILVGSEFALDRDTVHISKTIIDGDTSVSGMPDTGAVVWFVNGEDPSAVLKGFKIRNGVSAGGYRGGVYCRYSNPTISDCIVTSNEGTGVHAWGGYPTITDCRIIENTGSGIYCRYSDPTISDCIVTNNEGTGIHAWRAHPAIIDCRITENAGSGIYCDESCFNITDCLVMDNTGTGIDLDDCLGLKGVQSGSQSRKGCRTVSGCTIRENLGDGIHCYDVAGDAITDCTITGNGGRGVFCMFTLMTMPITDCIVKGNGGDGLYLHYAYAPVSRCQIVHNGGDAITTSSGPPITGCTTAGNDGWGLRYWGDKNQDGRKYFGPTLKNCILWGDSLGEIRHPHPHRDSVVAIYCDVEGGWLGEGNIDCDPWFCYPDTGDYHLAENSCCIGAGEGGADIGAFGSGCAARGFITGIVTDERLVPIEDVVVNVLGSSVEDTTDDVGQYCLDGLVADTFDVVFTHPDYHDVTVTGVVVTPGDTTTIDVALRYLICSLWAEPDTVSIGQRVSVYMSVRNMGSGSADSVGPEVGVLGHGEASLFAGPVPAYADILPGAEATFTWIYTAEDTHFVCWGGEASGTGHNSGCPVVSPSDTSNSIFIQIPAELQILAVTTGADTVRWGEKNIPVDIVVQNTGEADAFVDSADLRFVKDSVNVDDEYSVALLDTLDRLSGFSSDVYHFVVEVGWEATEGWVTIHSGIFGSDKNSGNTLIDTIATLPDSFYVVMGYACGDCNADTRVSVADATYVVSYIYRDGPIPLGDADVNVDQRVTIAGATYIVSYIYRSGPSPCEPPVTVSTRQKKRVER